MASQQYDTTMSPGSHAAGSSPCLPRSFYKEIIKHRSSVEISKGHLGAGKPRVIAHEVRHRFEACFGFGNGGRNLCLIRYRTSHRLRNPLDVNTPEQLRVRIIICDADQLIATSASSCA